MIKTKSITDQQLKELNEYIRNNNNLVTVYEDYNNIMMNLIETYYGLNLTRPNNMRPDFTKITMNTKVLERDVLSQQQLINKLHKYILKDNDICDAIINYNHSKQTKYIDCNEFKKQFYIDDWVKNNIQMFCPYQTYLNKPEIQEKYKIIHKKILNKCLMNFLLKVLIRCKGYITRNNYANNLYKELNTNSFEIEIFKINYLYYSYRNEHGIDKYYYSDIMSLLYLNLKYIYIQRFDFKSIDFINEYFQHSTSKSIVYNVLRVSNYIKISNYDELSELLVDLICCNFDDIIYDIIIKNSTLISNTDNIIHNIYNISEITFNRVNNFDIFSNNLNYNHSVSNTYNAMRNVNAYIDNKYRFLYLFQICQNHYALSMIYLFPLHTECKELKNVITSLFILNNIPKNDSELFNSIIHNLVLKLPYDIPNGYINEFYDRIGYNNVTGQFNPPINYMMFGGQTQHYNLFEKMINLILKISTLIVIVVILVYLFRIVRNIVHITHDEPEQVQHLQRRKQLVEVSSMNNAVNKYEIDNPNNLTIYDYVSHDIKNITTNE